MLINACKSYTVWQLTLLEFLFIYQVINVVKYCQNFYIKLASKRDVAEPKLKQMGIIHD